MTGSRSAPAIAALILAAACGRDTRAPATADTTGAASAPRSVAGFQAPESARYDPDLDVWYVTNINGSPVDKDGNGYISRLHGDGTVDAMKWIAGGANGVTLNAPKGMALQADTLWVADIDAVRGFDRRTGAPVASVTLVGAQFLNDVAVGADGLYATDSGLHVDAQGMTHPGPDRVYRIAPDRSQSVALESDSLAAPNGITWDAARKQFVIVPFFGNVIRAWTPGSKATIPLGTSKGQLDGVEILDAKRLLVTSWADSSLNVLENGTLTPVAGDLPSPADIGLDVKRGRVAIPLLMENRVEFRMLPTAERAAP